MGETLWRVTGLAAYLETSVATTYSLIEAGRIPGVVRLGPRAIRIDPQVVKEWVASGGFREEPHDFIDERSEVSQ
jgi:excisionase family DNA binding protein